MPPPPGIGGIAGSFVGASATMASVVIRRPATDASLAFLAPKLVQAAVQGRLPRGIGVTRMRDTPDEWFRQYAMLGLAI